jgi:hypothetical protein
LGSGGTADLIPKLMETLEPPDGDLVIYDTDPERLVVRIIEILDKKYADIHEDQEKHDQHWFLHRESDQAPSSRAG